ncbi:MAG: hypothetical protein IKR73_01805 [Oscillospiraceae bacterium]|nr:hypothetical protein [Oscillospiraceae bacterium]
MDRSSVIFGNKMSPAVIRRAEKTQQGFIDKYGDDRGMTYHLSSVPAPAIGDVWGVRQLVLSDETDVSFDEKSVIIGNIRMGFGHYRISMALVSAAHALGYDPYWFDLMSFRDTTASKIIAGQNELYSLGSRISQKSKVFNKAVWEPVNSEGFRKLDYNCSDQKTAELFTPVYADLPRDIPFIAAHVYPAQGAVHAGLTDVVNVIPDNWPMALHLAEGSLHTVQTPGAYLGYRALRGMDKKRILKPMPEDSIVYTGHYIDHEIVSNIEADCERRIRRARNGGARRYLLTIGGAGAQREIYSAVIKRLIPAVRKGKAVLLINVGDHANVWEELKQDLPYLSGATEHFDDIGEIRTFADDALDGEISGIHAFCNKDIFAAVWSTNLLLRCCDILMTKPGELSFYPVPKLMIRRVGGHEAWGAIRAAEIGDGTYECSSMDEIMSMLRMIQKCPDIIETMCGYILSAHREGIYNGAYKVIELAAKRRS